MLRSKTLKIKYMILTNASLSGNKTSEVKNEITNITAVEKKQLTIVNMSLRQNLIS